MAMHKTAVNQEVRIDERIDHPLQKEEKTGTRRSVGGTANGSSLAAATAKSSATSTRGRFDSRLCATPLGTLRRLVIGEQLVAGTLLSRPGDGAKHFANIGGLEEVEIKAGARQLRLLLLILQAVARNGDQNRPRLRKASC